MISFVPEHKSASSQPLLEYTAVMANSQGREYGLFFVFAISVLSCLTCTFVNVVNSSVALLTSKSHLQFCQTFVIIDVNPDASTQCPYMPFWSSLYERCRGKLPGCCPSNVFGWVTFWQMLRYICNQISGTKQKWAFNWWHIICIIAHSWSHLL